MSETQQPDSFELVTAWPYVGPQYRLCAPFGLRILILGESHYRDRPLTREFTSEVVQAAIDGQGDPSLRFFAKTVGVFFGGRQELKAREDFLRTVAFYNFVQEPAGTIPRARPSAAMWDQASPAFVEVLEKLQPQFVLVLGKELWKRISLPFEPGPAVQLSDGEPSESRLYVMAAGGQSFFFPINHPSSPGWSYSKWYPWVKAALEAANRRIITA